MFCFQETVTYSNAVELHGVLGRDVTISWVEWMLTVTQAYNVSMRYSAQIYQLLSAVSHMKSVVYKLNSITNPNRKREWSGAAGIVKR
jgi:hypothetical protein